MPTIQRSPPASSVRYFELPDVREPDLASQRDVVGAYLAAARDGDFEALLAVLGPQVVLRPDGGLVRSGFSREVRDASAVACSIQC